MCSITNTAHWQYPHLRVAGGRTRSATSHQPPPRYLSLLANVISKIKSGRHHPDGSVLIELKQMGACNQGKEFFIFIPESLLVDTRSVNFFSNARLRVSQETTKKYVWR